MIPAQISKSAAQGAALLLSNPAVPTKHELLVKTSQRLIAQTFFGAMLKQMRDSPFKSELFSGGRGEEAFSSLLDQHLADRMASGSGHRLADSIVRHIEKKHGWNTKPAPKAPGKSAFQARYERAGYGKQNPGEGRANVPADLRA
ncbi:MAG TPA: rod-binding protein [Tepidisphaeraceae bacterium]|nr:rod-binding protein [Tepidisphaeraceae bacterium]